MSLTIYPLSNRILIHKYEKEESRTTSGIFLPGASADKLQKGKALAVGEGRVLENGTIIPLTIKVGDIVLFTKYAGTDVDNERIIVREDDVLAIEKDTNV